jgi:Sulfotransferase domain
MSRLTKAWHNTHLYGRVFPQRAPQLLVIGAQKCGTSALFSYLAQHPRLVPAREKELDFFGSDLRYSDGMEWYCSRWERPTFRTIHFEASPQYLFVPQAAERIRSCIPRARLVAVLRDPISRAHSAWLMYRKQLTGDPAFYEKYYGDRYSAGEIAALVPRSAAELDDFQLAVEHEIFHLERGQRMQLGLVELGLYGPQLRRYFSVFPREQLLVLDNQDLRSNRIGTLDRVLEFSGLPAWDWSQADLQDVFVGNSLEPIPARAADMLSEYFRDSNRMLSQLLDEPPQFVRDEARLRASA